VLWRVGLTQAFRGEEGILDVTAVPAAYTPSSVRLGGCRVGRASRMQLRTEPPHAAHVYQRAADLRHAAVAPSSSSTLQSLGLAMASASPPLWHRTARFKICFLYSRASVVALHCDPTE
jgi:hypothetical protein